MDSGQGTSATDDPAQYTPAGQCTDAPDPMMIGDDALSQRSLRAARARRGRTSADAIRRRRRCPLDASGIGSRMHRDDGTPGGFDPAVAAPTSQASPRGHESAAAEVGVFDSLPRPSRLRAEPSLELRRDSSASSVRRGRSGRDSEPESSGVECSVASDHRAAAGDARCGHPTRARRRAPSAPRRGS